MTESRRELVARVSRYFLVIILLIAFAGLATYAGLSDQSIHGLTVRFYNLTWSCSSTDSAHPNSILIYTFGNVIVYSSNSLTTTVAHVTFSMSTNGVGVATVSASDKSFGPGQSASYALTFNDTGADPHSQPLVQQITLTINAQVTAGLYTSQSSAYDSVTERFTALPC